MSFLNRSPWKGENGNSRVVLLLFLYFSFLLLGQTLAKYASSRGSLLNPFTLGSYLCLISRGFIWVLILNRMKLITAYPLNALSYIIILPLSALLFAETLTPVRVVSALFIAAGVALLMTGEGIIKEAEKGEEG